MDNRITRASGKFPFTIAIGRSKKVSKPLKIVEEQVRQVVKQTRIDTLEEDNLFSLEY